MDLFFGKPWSQWVADYSLSHQNPVNQACHTFGIPMIVISLPLFAIGFWSQTLLSLAISLFVLGWILQLVGHIFEKKAPEFFKDWRFLFVGVRWWWSRITKNHTRP